MKKNECISREWKIPGLQKVLRIMKLTVFLFLLSVISVFAGKSYSQNKVLNLNLKNSTVKEVLRNIEKQSEFVFMYSEKLIDVNREVSVTVKNKKINEVLDELFAGTDVSYKVKDRFVLLTTPEVTGNDLIVQQQNSISGTVTDESGQPLPGVTVLIKGTTQGTVTNADGNYSLSNIPEDAALVFSFVGMLSQEVEVGSNSNISITMVSDEFIIDEVVAIGYRTKKRGEITGSVKQISGEELQLSSQTNLVKSLQGKVAGLVVNDRGGEPGQEAIDFLVRGKSTLGNNSPLVVIDGVPQSANALSLMTSVDIESISVLKDASAAIYGARAANGVILVQTKRGRKDQKGQITFTADYTVSKFARIAEKENAYNSAIYLNEIDERYNRAPSIDANLLQQFKDGTFDPNFYADNDWVDLTFRDWAPRQNYNLSYRGGSQMIQYFVSGDMLKEGGMMESNDMDYNRYQYRANIDFFPVKFLKIGLDLSGNIQKNIMPQANGGGAYWRAGTTNPWDINTYPNGLLGPGRINGSNPVTDTRADLSGWKETYNNTFGTKISFQLDMDWIIKSLKLSGYSFFDFGYSDQKSFATSFEYFIYNSTIKDYESAMFNNGNNSLSQTMRNNRNKLYHIQLEYDRTFGNHKFGGFIAYEQMEGFSKYLSASRQGLVSRTMPEMFSGEQDGRTNDGSSTESGRVNYFGALSYNYLEKYLLDFSLRYDGSFNFAKDKRFGLFPGVSVGWRISKESFMDGTKGWLNDFKIRASYSELGNDQVPAFQYLSTYALGQQYILGNPAQFQQGIYQSNVPNPGITWEVAKYKNIGFDAQLWKELLSISIDYYYENRTGILIKRLASIPEYAALELPDENLGKVDNSGIDLNIGHKNNINNLKYNLEAVFSYNHNKVVYMDEPANVSEYLKQEGHPQDSWVVYKSDGIFHTQEEVDNTEVKLDGTKPGDIKLVDLDGDGKITGNDRYRKFSSQVPEIQFGLNAGLEYKEFEFNVFLQGQANAEIFLLPKGAPQIPYKYEFESRWTEENKYAEQPRAYASDDFYNGHQRVSDFHIFDASFIKVKDIEFAYNVPFKRSNYSLRIYLKSANLWTLDHIKHFDPEVTNSGAAYYPQTTRFSTGLTFMF